MNSPIGTAKNRKANGKARVAVTRQPSTRGTHDTIMAANAVWVAAATLTRSPNHHSKAAPTIGNSAQADGEGCSGASSPRLRQISQATMGGTTNAWVKVSERIQMWTIAAPVFQ